MTRRKFHSRPHVIAYLIRAREGGFKAVGCDGSTLAHIRGSNPAMEATHRLVSEATGSVVTLISTIYTVYPGITPVLSITADEHDATVARLEAAELEHPAAAA